MDAIQPDCKLLHSVRKEERKTNQTRPNRGPARDLACPSGAVPLHFVRSGFLSYVCLHVKPSSLVPSLCARLHRPRKPHALPSQRVLEAALPHFVSYSQQPLSACLLGIFFFRETVGRDRDKTAKSKRPVGTFDKKNEDKILRNPNRCFGRVD